VSGLRVTADRAVCAGLQVCAGIAPEVFGLDDEGLVVVNEEAVEEHGDEVREAVLACPKQALDLN
jgi:ferredoxin